MTAPFASPEHIWPELLARITRAHESYGADLTDTVHGVVSLDTRIAEAVLAARADGEPTVSRVPSLDSKAARAAFDEAFMIAERLFGDAGLLVPDATDFTAAGVDFTGLGSRVTASLEPDSEFPLTPVLAPHGLGSKWWLDRYAALRAEASIVDNPLRKSADGDGLSLASDVRAGFRSCDTAPDGTRNGRVPVVIAARAANAHMPGELEWTLRLIPAGPTPVHVNLNHRAGGAEHPTLPEMLALQAGRILTGLAPVDQGIFTWLSGTLSDGRLAARHIWDDVEGVLRISCREIGNQGSYLGVRPPVATP